LLFNLIEVDAALCTKRSDDKRSHLASSVDSILVRFSLLQQTSSYCMITLLWLPLKTRSVSPLCLSVERVTMNLFSTSKQRGAGLGRLRAPDLAFAHPDDI